MRPICRRLFGRPATASNDVLQLEQMDPVECVTYMEERKHLFKRECLLHASHVEIKRAAFSPCQLLTVPVPIASAQPKWLIMLSLCPTDTATCVEATVESCVLRKTYALQVRSQGDSVKPGSPRPRPLGPPWPFDTGNVRARSRVIKDVMYACVDKLEGTQ